MKIKFSCILIFTLLFSNQIFAKEVVIDLGQSFFPKKDYVIDADTPDEITVKYKIMYYISDGCAYDVVTSYKLGGCPRKKYKTLKKESKYVLKIDKSSAKKGRGPQLLRLSVKQKEKNSYDILPVVEIIDGSEDRISYEDSWFGPARVVLDSRDHMINDSRKNLKVPPQKLNQEQSTSPALGQ